MPLQAPPLFIITKQNNCTLDDLFYKILEDRGIIREKLIKHLIANYSKDDWSKVIVEGLVENSLHLFMQFSLQTTLAKEQIDKDLSSQIYIDTLIEQGPFNYYMFPKYF